MNTKIRKTRCEDLSGVMAVFDEARVTIAALGSDQWQDGYPHKEIIEEDISLGVSHCIEDTDSGEVISTFALFFDGEPLYDDIFDGEWKTGDSFSSLGEKVSYVALHRVAISVKARGSGLSTAIINFAVDAAKIENKRSVRIDTHEGNVVMRRMLEKHGFVHCGTIYLEDGAPRVAYEKVI